MEKITGVIDIKDISKSYSGHQALKDISFSVPQGSIYGLLGPNGAGKTTLIRIINQIIQQDSGQIHIDGKPLDSDHISIIGYLPEERGLYKKMTVRDQLIYLGRLRGLSKSEASKRIEAWTKRLEIYDWLNAKVEDLSKGMAQKIQFIANVLHEPKLIILDEPFSGFDPVNANRIKEEILQLRENGSTILFSTHRMESVEELCDHFTLIDNAEVIISGEKMAIKEQFRDGTFELSHSNTFQAADELYSLVSTESISEGKYMSKIKPVEGKSTKDMLYDVLSKTDVSSFKEDLPSIDTIFITLTTEK